jgi:hypothetical protein
MNEELTKSLTQLIDETLQELEELKKSRCEAQEIKLQGKDDGIDGHEANGDIEKDEDEKDEDEKDEDHDEDHEEEAMKGENEKALKAEDEDHEEDEEQEEEEAEKADEDPADAPEVGRKLKGILGNKKMSKYEHAHKAEKEPHKEDPEHEKKEKKLARKLLDMHKKEGHKSPEQVEKDMEHLEMKGMKKSIMAESSELMKGLIDERVKPLEDKLSVILTLVNQIAEQPVSPRGVTARTAPLLKSVDEGEYETLTKSQVASKLFELKKSGSPVDSLDVAKAEMGQDLGVIVKKYKLS